MRKLNNILQHVGNKRGHTRDKYNRVQRLIDKWETLRTKMESFIVRGHGHTHNARCAYAILLMMETGIRIGNESSAEGYICNQKHHKDFGKQVQVYGLTTIRKEHVQINKNAIILSFLGKKAVEQILRTKNSTLKAYYSHMLENTSDLFLGITYRDCYLFIRKYVGKYYMPKDIRTAAVNILFSKIVNNTTIPQIISKKLLNKTISHFIERTAEQIGHTKGVCKRSYLSSNMIEYVKARIL